MNSVTLALVHCLHADQVELRGLRGLHHLCQAAVQNERVLLLASQLQFRSVLREWHFDGRQHDASEFALAFLRGLGLTFGRWEARTAEADGVAEYEVPQEGAQPVIIPLGEHGMNRSTCNESI